MKIRNLDLEYCTKFNKENYQRSQGTQGRTCLLTVGKKVKGVGILIFNGLHFTVEDVNAYYH